MAGKKIYGKDYFVRHLANETGGMTLTKSYEITNCILNEMFKLLLEGKVVKLGDVGTLYVKERAARTGTDPRTGASIDIAASHFVKCNISTALRKKLKERSYENE